jgi:hypothetical protein
MSDYPAPNNYQIENTWWAERFVTLGKNNAIVGSRFITGGTQVVSPETTLFTSMLLITDM